MHTRTHACAHTAHIAYKLQKSFTISITKKHIAHTVLLLYYREHPENRGVICSRLFCLISTVSVNKQRIRFLD